LLDQNKNLNKIIEKNGNLKGENEKLNILLTNRIEEIELINNEKIYINTEKEKLKNDLIEINNNIEKEKLNIELNKNEMCNIKLKNII
jgi:hypothetical protein